MILFKVIQEYYIQHNSFSGIESTSFYNIIKDAAKNKNMNIDDYLYLALGYTSDNIISSKQRYDFRKAFICDDMKYLGRYFGKDKIQVANKLQEIDALGIIMDDCKPGKFTSLCKVLGDYFRNNGDCVIMFNKYRNKANSITSLEGLKLFRNSPELVESIKVIMPKIKFVKDAEPSVCNDIFIVNVEKLTNRDIVYIMREAINYALFNTDKIPATYLMRLRRLLVRRDQVNAEMILPILIDASINYNVTLKDILYYCNAKESNILQQIDDTNCIGTPDMKTRTITVLSLNSKDSKDKLVCSFEGYTYLYENDLLKTLTFDESGHPYVVTDRKISAYKVIGGM